MILPGTPARGGDQFGKGVHGTIERQESVQHAGEQEQIIEAGIFGLVELDGDLDACGRRAPPWPAARPMMCRLWTLTMPSIRARVSSPSAKS